MLPEARLDRRDACGAHETQTICAYRGPFPKAHASEDA